LDFNKGILRKQDVHTEFSMEKLQKNHTLKAEKGRMSWHEFLLENMLCRQDEHGTGSEMCPTGSLSEDLKLRVPKLSLYE
jgi:hypothetical protein